MQGDVFTFGHIKHRYPEYQKCTLDVFIVWDISYLIGIQTLDKVSKIFIKILPIFVS
jgi:hypothetical protein